MRFRIGINLGDVIVDGGNLFGDGVNVAVRLEALAEPGGICLSSAVYEQVEQKLPLGYEDIGPQALKNIVRPVKAYRVSLRRGGGHNAFDHRNEHFLIQLAGSAIGPLPQCQPRSRH